MRKRALVIAVATALISLAAVESASAVVITQTQTSVTALRLAAPFDRPLLAHWARRRSPPGSADQTSVALDLAVADWDWAASVVVDLVVAVSTSTCISNHAQRAEKPRAQRFGAFSVARTRVHSN